MTKPLYISSSVIQAVYFSAIADGGEGEKVIKCRLHQSIKSLTCAPRHASVIPPDVGDECGEGPVSGGEAVAQGPHHSDVAGP